MRCVTQEYFHKSLPCFLGLAVELLGQGRVYAHTNAETNSQHPELIDSNFAGNPTSQEPQADEILIDQPPLTTGTVYNSFVALVENELQLKDVLCWIDRIMLDDRFWTYLLLTKDGIYEVVGKWFVHCQESWGTMPDWMSSQHEEIHVILACSPEIQNILAAFSEMEYRVPRVTVLKAFMNGIWYSSTQLAAFLKSLKKGVGPDEKYITWQTYYDAKVNYNNRLISALRAAGKLASVALECHQGGPSQPQYENLGQACLSQSQYES